MSEPNHKFYLTTPIYYVNARPHIGHAYTTIAADVIARRHRLLGDDTFFLTGTDEHGQKIQRSAEAVGIPPQQFADEVSASFQNLWKRMGITNDDYIRTTEPHHKRGVQKLFADLYARGFIELRTYTGQYCVSEEMFIEGPPGTIGPDGKPTETVSEENFFFKLSEFQLPLLNLIESNTLAISPESRRNEVLSFLRGNASLPDTRSGTLIMTEDQSILSEMQRIVSELQNNPNEAHLPHPKDMRITAAGTPYCPGALKDLSISRSSFRWGIPVPEPAASVAKEKHVIYVWLDALANYMTAIGYGSDDPAEQAKFEKYWPADLHLVGKEIIRFHCIYWPAFLLAAELPLPKAITAHGWLLFENDKMSKSKGNIVRTETILDAFGTLCPPTPPSSPTSPNTFPFRSAAEESVSSLEEPQIPTKAEQDLFAADVLRYFLLREIPFGQDGSFSFDALVQRYNSDLANGYGNLVSRVLKMIHVEYGGSFTKLQSTRIVMGVYTEDNSELIAYGSEGIEQLAGLTAKMASEKSLIDRDVLGQFDFFRYSVDRYLSANAPWKLNRELPNDEARKREILYTAAESIRIITALLYPILPYATSKVWAQLGLGDIEEAARSGELNNLKWGGLKPGTKLGPLGPIFPRAPKELIQLMNDIETANAPKPNGSNGSKSVVALPQVNSDLDASARHRTEFAEMPIASASATPALNKAAETVHPIASHHSAEPAKPETPQIAIDDFVKIDLRVAQIVVAERIPKADKLLRLEVDLGYERRQILSGIAQWYTPEELIGRRIVIIANLAPRKMRGLESHGMLLAASKGEDDKPVLATFGEEIALGSRLK